MADAPIPVYSPEGTYGSIDPSEFDAAVAQGYRPASDAEIHHETNKASASGIVGKIAAGTGSAANAMTFGGFEAALKRIAPELADRLSASQEENPVTAGIGSVAGIGTSLVTGEPIFAGIKKAGEAVAAPVQSAVANRIGRNMVGDFASQLAGKTAQFATEGAALVAPKAAAEVVTDPEQAAETLVHGAELGGGIGVGAGVLGPFLRTAGKGLAFVGDKAPDYLADTVDNVQYGQDAKRLGFTKRFYNKFGQDRVQELVDFARKKNLFGVVDKAEDPWEAVDELRKQAGKDIGDVLDGIDATTKRFVDTSKMLDTIRKQVPEPEGELMDTERTAYQKALNDINAKVLDRNGDPKLISLRNLQDLKKTLGDYAWGDRLTPRPGRAPVAQMERILDGTMEESLTYAQKSFPDRAADWLAAKQEYRNYKTLLDPIKDMVAKELGNQIISPSTWGAGMIGAATGGGMGAVRNMVLNTLRNQYGAAVFSGSINLLKTGIEKTNDLINSGVQKYMGAMQSAPQQVQQAIANLNPGSLGALEEYLGEKPTSKAEALKTLNDHLSTIVSNSEATSTALAQVAPGLGESSPDTQAALQQKLLSAVQYLHAQIPKPETPSSPLAPSAFTPTDREVASFERKLRVAMNPFSVIEDMHNGVLTPDSIDALQQIYPKFHQQLSGSIIEKGSTRKTPLSFKQRLQLSGLMNSPLDGTLQAGTISALQASYLSPDAHVTPGAPTRKVRFGEQFDTDLGRVSAR